ncbi:MAG: hypothetical protein ACLU3I_06135 [Acutalibacteraceae bacterium]
MAAESTNANGGHFGVYSSMVGQLPVLSFNYVCKNNHNTHDGYFTYNLNSVQLKKADGHIVFMAEWKPKTPFVQTLPFQNSSLDICDEKIDGTITKRLNLRS